MSSLPNLEYPDASRIADQLAPLVNGLDDVVVQARKAADTAVVAHARSASFLADIVVRLIELSADYRPSNEVLAAIGHPYAEGPLWTAAMRAGLLLTGQSDPGMALRIVETDLGKQVDIVARIEKVCADGEPVRFGQ